MSALAGDPDLYPWVFWALNVTPGSPGAMSQKPMGQWVPTGILMTDLHRYSQVYPQVSTSRSRNRYIFHITNSAGNKNHYSKS